MKEHLEVYRCAADSYSRYATTAASRTHQAACLYECTKHACSSNCREGEEAKKGNGKSQVPIGKCCRAISCTCAQNLATSQRRASFDASVGLVRARPSPGHPKSRWTAANSSGPGKR